jgi:hypothetical protein
MRASAYLHIADDKRLGINLIVDNSLEEHSELLPIDIARGKNCLVQIRPCPSRVIVLCQHVYLSRSSERYQAAGRAHSHTIEARYLPEIHECHL